MRRDTHPAGQVLDRLSRRSGRLGRRGIAVALLVGCGLSACSQETTTPAYVETVWFSSGTVIAVAPALNFSGNSNFDPVVLADLMGSELAGFPGVGVISVNRTMAIMAEQGVTRVQSPQHAQVLCERLGADAILVFAVTEYDAYTPVVGLTAQMYTRRPAPASAPADELESQPQTPVRPAAECQQVFNAAHERVRNALRNYADKRKEGESPYGWKVYLASQERYFRFCCHSIARELLRQQTYEFGVARTAAQ